MAAIAARARRWPRPGAPGASAPRERAEAAARLAKARADEDYLRHALAELDALEPKPGEEVALADERALLMHREKLTEALDAALAELAGERGGERALASAERLLGATARQGRGQARRGAGRARARPARDARGDGAARSGGARPRSRPSSLEQIEERLFALRALARKHGVALDALPELRAELARRIAALDDGGDRLAHLARRSRRRGRPISPPPRRSERSGGRQRRRSMPRSCANCRR